MRVITKGYKFVVLTLLISFQPVYADLVFSDTYYGVQFTSLNFDNATASTTTSNSKIKYILGKKYNE